VTEISIEVFLLGVGAVVVAWAIIITVIMFTIDKFMGSR